MSTLTEAVLYARVWGDEADFIEAATRPVADWRGQAFRALDIEQAGGFKFFCGQVFAACFNYVLPEDVEAFVKSLPWGNGEGVLVIDYEHEDAMRVMRLGYGHDQEDET